MYLQAGNSLTPIDALEKFNCFRLAARVKNLRDAGVNIRSELLHTSDGKKYARYWIAN
jgi:hypothetical protein